MLRSSLSESGAAWPRRWLRPVLLVLAGLGLAAVRAGSAGGAGAVAGSGGAAAAAQALAPGDTVERPIEAGEAHAFRATVTGAPLLLVVEQRGIDLVVVDRLAAGGDPVLVDAQNRRWGAEVLLLEAAGEHRVEIESLDAAAASGAYSLRLEAMAGEGADGERRRAAAAAMTRGSRKPSAWTLEALRHSLAAYREALPGWRAVGDRYLEAETLFAIAGREDWLGERVAAGGDFERALAIWRELGETRREADTLDRLGGVRVELGQTEAARSAIADALDLWRRLGDRLEEGATLVDAGYVEYASGALLGALSPYQQALAVFRELGARREAARALNNLGGLYDGLGEPQAALDSYQEALALRRELGERSDVAQTLSNIAVVDRALGDWEAALEAYQQALAMLAPLHQPSQKAKTLNNLAFLYLTLGEPARALPLFEEALALHHGVSDRRSEVLTRNNLGVVWRALGDLDRALAEHRQALGEAEKLGDPWLQALVRLQVAQVRIEKADVAAATDVAAAKALLVEIGDRRLEALALQLEGRVLSLADRPAAALGPLGQALERRRSIHDRAGEAETLDELAAVERRLGRRDQARAHAEEAISAIEGLRIGLGSLGLRASFLASRHRAYELLIDLLMDRHLAEPAAGFDRRALEVSEHARARSLLDMLHDRRSGRREGVPAELLARRQALTYRLSAWADGDEQPATGGAPAAAETARGRQLESLLAELDGVEAEIRRRAPGGEAGAGGDLAPLGAEAIQRLLDPGTVLLEIALGRERSHAWTISERGIHSAVLPGEREIGRQARQLYQTLSTFEPGGRANGGDSLSQLLLAPVWAEVGRAGRLVVVPDAPLDLIPWGALRVPLPRHGWRESARVPLIELQEVVEIPSATTLAVERRRLAGRPAAARRAAVFADPVFAAADPRVGGARPARQVAASPGMAGRGSGALAPDYERLPATRREAAAIAGLAPAGEVHTALDFAASREAVLSSELRSYRVLHFATHSIADTRHPELSGMVLSLVDAGGRQRRGLVRLPDLYDLDLGADLVVLSGCRTALGRELRGEGLMGLTRGFEAAGVPRVVGSLWRVEDRASAEIMTRFYRAMWREGASPSAALRAAQRAVRRDPRYRAPHFWAGFVHQGDWRAVR
jgi:tetratricopeptide (TPR) repeat protein